MYGIHLNLSISLDGKETDNIFKPPILGIQVETRMKSLNKVAKSVTKGFGRRANFLFTAKTNAALVFLTVITKSLPLIWLVGDAILSIKLYQKQNFQEHALRWARLGIGVTWFVGLLNPLLAGFLLVVDGVYSIARYRYYNITKDFIEDVPRLARIGVGFLIMAAIPMTLPSLGIL